ncbi:MAG: hypothetical protein ORN98_01110 [Alphaproteobacteria bacterium]|nr:hypothetical protein [Alphaproteobacteria bacterium]
MPLYEKFKSIDADDAIYIMGFTFVIITVICGFWGGLSFGGGLLGFLFFALLGGIFIATPAIIFLSVTVLAPILHIKDQQERQKP